MPSIQLTRLREQLADLINLVQAGQPEVFHRALRDLLDKYSEHALRAGETVQPRSMLPSYHTPALVARQLEIELAAEARRQPEQMLAVADALWKDDHLEPRLLAAHILGSVPATHTDAVIRNLRAWAGPQVDRLALAELFERGASTLRASAPRDYLMLIREWLDDKNTAYRQMGLRTLESLIDDPNYANLPVAYDIITPLVLTPSSPLMNNLHHVLRALARKSPGETAYFLRQALGQSANPATPRLVRRVLPEFPADFQASLREALRNYAKP